MSRFRLFDLNPAQHDAATTLEGPLLILAGAGTGKTRVITARIAVLLGHDVPPHQILAVTFTNKAANEMRDRIKGMVDDAKGLNISTFHALCLRILRVSIEKLGYKNTFAIYSEGDQLGLLKKIINRTSAQDENLEPAVAKAWISKAKNNGWRPPEDDETLVGSVYRQYQIALKQLNAVDFDDLLMLAVRVMVPARRKRAERGDKSRPGCTTRDRPKAGITQHRTRSPSPEPVASSEKCRNWLRAT